MLHRAGAGTQHPMHFSCAPARSHTITANSESKHNKSRYTATPTPKRWPSRGYGPCGAVGHKGTAIISTTSPLAPLFPVTNSDTSDISGTSVPV